MATIEFRKTVFFGYTSAGLTNADGDTTIVSDAAGMTQVKLTDSEADVNLSDVTLRAYELYIDYYPSAESGDAKTVSGIAKVTDDATKTYDEGYDLYVSAEPTSNVPLNTSGSLAVKVLHATATVEIRVVYIGEVIA